MMRPVAGTILTRIFIMVMNILVIMIAGHALGAKGLGDISLVVLAITFFMLLSNVVGGGAIVYLLPRHSLHSLLAPSYAWALISAVVAVVVVHYVHVAPPGTELHVVALALIQSIYTIHFNVLLGRQRIRAINILQLTHSIVLLGSFLYLLRAAERPDVMQYVHASYFSFLTTMVGSIVMISLHRSEPKFGEGPVLGRLVKQGGSIQIANFLQLINYRLAYYLIERFQGTAALGVYSVANQMAEASWVAPRSLGSVLYGRVSNTKEAAEILRMTITSVKAAAIMSLGVVLVLVALPDALYSWLFGPEITEITRLLLVLAPGIVTMAISQVLSHYYSGTGRNKHNALGSGVGVVATMIAGWTLIPSFGLLGAAATASLAYGSIFIYQMVVFLRTTGTPLGRFWIEGSDRERIQRLFKRI